MPTQNDTFWCIVCFKQKPNSEKAHAQRVIYYRWITPGWICKNHPFILRRLALARRK